jgi:hypothetical protein
LTGSADITLIANGSYLKSGDVVTGYLALDTNEATSGSVYTYTTTDLSFTIEDTGSQLNFSSIATPGSGEDFYVEIEYRDGTNNPVSQERVSLTDTASFTPTLPTGATGYAITGIYLGLDMPVNSDGSYEGSLKTAYFNDIATQFTPFSVEVKGSDNVVYARDNSLVASTYQPQLGQLDYAAINALSDGTAFTTAMQVPDVPAATVLDILTKDAAGVDVSNDLSKGNFLVSEDDQLALTVEDKDGTDITAVATSGDNVFDVHLSNRVDFLGFDINSDGDYLDDYEIAINGVVGDASTDDSTGQLWLDVSDAVDGDGIEVLADGNVIFTHTITQSEINTGKINTGDINLNISDDITGANGNTGVEDDDKVNLEIRVNYNSGDGSSDQSDVTWEYQW